MKNVVVIMIVFLLIAHVSYATMTWDHKWECDEVPEDFESGSVFSYTDYGTSINRWMYTDPVSEDNMVKWDANPAMEGFDYSTKPGMWIDSDSTIDFNYKTLAWRDGQNSTVQLKITSATRDWVSGFTFAKDSTGSFIQDIGTSTNRVYHSHVSGTGQYRILYYAIGEDAGDCKLYYDDGSGAWSLLLTSYGYSQVQTLDKMSVRDPSSSFAGAYSISKHYWTNQGATLSAIAPEPCTVILLGFGGLISLGCRKV